MRDIAEIRAELDQVDMGIVALLEARMDLAREVAEWKMENHRPVLDTARELKVLESRCGMLRTPGREEQVIRLFNCLMSMSREEQEKIIEEAERHV